MKYYLDTNIIIYSLKNSFPAIQRHFMQIPSQSVLIPSVVLAEIEYGAQKSQDYDRTIHLYRQFTDAFEEVGFSGKAVACYGRLRALLEKAGQTIGANDMLIAATVLAAKGTLVTHNVRDFQRIPGLILEDWTV